MDGAVWFTTHAIERYVERLRPALTKKAARRELVALCEVAEVVTERPAWLGLGEATDGYLLLGDDVVLPVMRGKTGWVAMTCMTRGGLAPSERRARNRAAKARRYARSHKPRDTPRPPLAA
jgi:hypothetical protein